MAALTRGFLGLRVYGIIKCDERMLERERECFGAGHETGSRIFRGSWGFVDIDGEWQFTRRSDDNFGWEIFEVSVAGVIQFE